MLNFRESTESRRKKSLTVLVGSVLCWFNGSHNNLIVLGQGVYTTAEGDTYSGFWDADRLVACEGTTVSYNDGAKYEGVLKEWCYSGKGTYTYPDSSVLKCEFNDNCPIGNLVLTDPNGHTWLGKSELGFGWFEPVNHFYELLETTQTRVKRRHKLPQPADTMSATAQPTVVVAKGKNK